MVNNEGFSCLKFDQQLSSFVLQESGNGLAAGHGGARSFPLAIFIGLVVLVITTVFLFRYLVPRWRAMRDKIRLVCMSGYLPDPPSESDSQKMRKVSRFAVWLQIGRVKWSGLDNLSGEFPKLIVPTHGHYLDPFVLAAQMPARTRVMAARGLFKFGGGLGGLVFSRWGAFCTDLDSGKGLPALRTAVKVLVSGQSLIIFPEGWAHMDGLVGPFNPGIAGIAHLAASKMNKPLHIIPVYMRYGKYPAKWIKPLPTSIQCLILMAGFVRYRRGVHVVFGEPLLTSNLPQDPHLATEQIRNTVLSLNPLLMGQEMGD